MFMLSDFEAQYRPFKKFYDTKSWTGKPTDSVSAYPCLRRAHPAVLEFFLTLKICTVICGTTNIGHKACYLNRLEVVRGMSSSCFVTNRRWNPPYCSNFFDLQNWARQWEYMLWCRPVHGEGEKFSSIRRSQGRSTARRWPCSDYSTNNHLKHRTSSVEI